MDAFGWYLERSWQGAILGDLGLKLGPCWLDVGTKMAKMSQDRRVPYTGRVSGSVGSFERSPRATSARCFSCGNLVPQRVPVLRQDCPYVPFNKLVSAESQARLSVCRPHSSLEEASSTSGVPRYSHITGSVDYRRRAPLQLASSLTEDVSSP